jgi:tetratricopeptide (TPR) repeat protein
MPQRPNSKATAARAAMIAAALGVFSWGVYWMPAPASGKSSLSPEKARALHDKGAVMRRYGNWMRALPPTLELHEAYPESHIYIAELAEIYHHLSRYREEAAMWEAFWMRAPLPIEACPQIGDAYRLQGLAKQAIGALERCLALEPESPDQLFYLAHELERNGDIERAGALYAHGLVVKAGDPDLAIGLARVRLRQGKYAECGAAAGSVIERTPNNPDALLVLGLLATRQGHRAEAKNYLERGVHAADGYADLHLALANLAEQDANLDAAIFQYRRVTELDKSNSEAVEKLQMLERARR